MPYVTRTPTMDLLAHNFFPNIIHLLEHVNPHQGEKNAKGAPLSLTTSNAE